MRATPPPTNAAASLAAREARARQEVAEVALALLGELPERVERALFGEPGCGWAAALEAAVADAQRRLRERFPPPGR